MRRWILGIVASLCVTGAAHAADFVVVSSTDPTIARGQAYESGALIQLATGKSIVLIDTAGQVTRLTGGPRGAVAPRRQLASVSDERITILKRLVEPPRVRRSGPSGKVCPAADLTLLDGIVEVAQVDGCLATARTAFEAYVAKALEP